MKLIFKQGPNSPKFILNSTGVYWLVVPLSNLYSNTYNCSMLTGQQPTTVYITSTLMFKTTFL